jgi:hypothetical protein
MTSIQADHKIDILLLAARLQLTVCSTWSAAGELVHGDTCQHRVVRIVRIRLVQMLPLTAIITASYTPRGGAKPQGHWAPRHDDPHVVVCGLSLCLVVASSLSSKMPHLVKWKMVCCAGWVTLIVLYCIPTVLGAWTYEKVLLLRV